MKKKKKKIKKKSLTLSPYLDFSVFELNRVIKRKDILENKAYIFGTLLFGFVFFDKGFFNLFNYLNKINSSEMFIKFLLNIIAIICCIIAFIYLWRTLNLSENRYLNVEKFEIKNRKNEDKFEQEETIIRYHLVSTQLINRVAEEKSKYLSLSIKFGLVFFGIYFLFLLGGEKMEEIESSKLLLMGKDIEAVVGTESTIGDNKPPAANDENNNSNDSDKNE